MTTIYDAAVRNFKAAADVLGALHAARLDLVTEARSWLVGRPRLGLVAGYNDLGELFGACLPGMARAEFLLPESGKGLELRCAGADWMTLEGALPGETSAQQCYLEMQVSADRPLIADVFLREFLDGGAVRDSGHRECDLSDGAIKVCALPLPAADADVTGLRIIVHLRQPSQRIIIDRLAVTLT